MAQVFVGIGSNIEPERYLRLGVQGLAQRYGELSCSAVYASAPVGIEGPEFLNMVVGLETAAPAAEVAHARRTVERQHSLPPRALDLDFLLYDDLISQMPCLPRADIERYAFVLRPLAEHAPTLRHPIRKVTYADLWAAFPATEQPLREVELALW